MGRRQERPRFFYLEGQISSGYQKHLRDHVAKGDASNAVKRALRRARARDASLQAEMNPTRKESVSPDSIEISDNGTVFIRRQGEE